MKLGIWAPQFLIPLRVQMPGYHVQLIFSTKAKDPAASTVVLQQPFLEQQHWIQGLSMLKKHALGAHYCSLAKSTVSWGSM